MPIKSLLPDRPKPPVVFECTACLATMNSRDHHIPVGWSQQGASIWCTDCSASTARRASGRRSARA